MVPFYFGASSHQLFGVYHPGVGGTRKGAVICSPCGQEYLRAQRAIRFLASRISETGGHVLRFDWYGTGDSAGSVFEGSGPESWLEDLDVAVEELKAMANLRKVSLVGLRLGALPAIQMAQERRGIDRLVLWDPVLDGAGYVDELLAHSQARSLTGSADLPEQLQGESVHEVLGFPITPAIRKGMESFTPASLGKRLPPTLLLSTASDPERYAPVRTALDASGTDWTEERFDGPEAWVEEDDFGTSGMPVEALRRVAAWLGS